MMRGAWVIIAATGIFVGLVVLGTCYRKVNAEVENRTGRAADRTGESSVQSETQSSQEDRFDSAQVRLARLFDAIRQVESGGNENPPDGDGGKAIGEYQIWKAYWQDSGVPGDYQQCRNRAYAERVVLAYWQRYCPDALASGDWQTLARVHNGGPRGAQKKATLKYWHMVKEVMQ